ncbi:MAG: hypothetical protein PHI12_07795 [Dehalococcoidales bacterium]|jgi:hypothetical protein|nr:hypothetical protein [Dehalococcoidales bacterium]
MPGETVLLSQQVTADDLDRLMRLFTFDAVLRQGELQQAQQYLNYIKLEGSDSALDLSSTAKRIEEVTEQVNFDLKWIGVIQELQSSITK